MNPQAASTDPTESLVACIEARLFERNRILSHAFRVWTHRSADIQSFRARQLVMSSRYYDYKLSFVFFRAWQWNFMSRVIEVRNVAKAVAHCAKRDYRVTSLTTRFYVRRGFSSWRKFAREAAERLERLLAIRKSGELVLVSRYFGSARRRGLETRTSIDCNGWCFSAKRALVEKHSYQSMAHHVRREYLQHCIAFVFRQRHRLLVHSVLSSRFQLLPSPCGAKEPRALPEALLHAWHCWRVEAARRRMMRTKRYRTCVIYIDSLVSDYQRREFYTKWQLRSAQIPRHLRRVRREHLLWRFMKWVRLVVWRRAQRENEVTAKKLYTKAVLTRMRSKVQVCLHRRDLCGVADAYNAKVSSMNLYLRSNFSHWANRVHHRRAVASLEALCSNVRLHVVADVAVRRMEEAVAADHASFDLLRRKATTLEQRKSPMGAANGSMHKDMKIRGAAGSRVRPLSATTLTQTRGRATASPTPMSDRGSASGCRSNSGSRSPPVQAVHESSEADDEGLRRNEEYSHLGNHNQKIRDEEEDIRDSRFHRGGINVDGARRGGTATPTHSVASSQNMFQRFDDLLTHRHHHHDAARGGLFLHHPTARGDAGGHDDGEDGTWDMQEDGGRSALRDEDGLFQRRRRGGDALEAMATRRPRPIPLYYTNPTTASRGHTRFRDTTSNILATGRGNRSQQLDLLRNHPQGGGVGHATFDDGDDENDDVGADALLPVTQEKLVRTMAEYRLLRATKNEDTSRISVLRQILSNASSAAVTTTTTSLDGPSGSSPSSAENGTRGGGGSYLQACERELLVLRHRQQHMHTLKSTLQMLMKQCVSALCSTSQ